ncbi:FtsX-like permease family protein [Streptomyces sp. NBC_01476]|uniref:FtsX-like permease family protein n=1 Tax=Streptomyces sp. NBC_01476 TaxID=2903881 RepID=UPI003FCC38DC
MAARVNSWRAAVRIARRDALRYRGRSVLVLLMIALPIMGVSAADITVRSSQLTEEQKVDRDVGAADARLLSAGQGGQPVLQSPSGDEYEPVHQEAADGTGAEDTGAVGTDDFDVDPKVALPAGAHWLTDDDTYAAIRTRTGLLYTTVRELKAADPLAAGIMALDRGRFPAAPDEMAATNAFLKSSGLHVGSRVTAYGLGRGYRIVGAYDLPSQLDTEQLNTLPGTFIKPYLAARQAIGASADTLRPPSYLVAVPGDFTWAMVQRANTLGVGVDSREVRLHPPADSEVPLYRRNGGPRAFTSDDNTAVIAAGATTVGLAMLEICLLAGPAFAVGARRSQRQLGLVGANGGDRRHIRAIVLAGGLVIGVAAAVVGTLAGALLTVVLRGPLENSVGQRFGGIEVRPLELLGIAALAVLTGLLAAVVPAVTSSRQSVLASLTGRRGVRRTGRTLPVIGLGAVCLGAGIAVFGSLRTRNPLAVGFGSGVAELGLVAMTPVLVGAFGRLGKWLPLVPRLALRDAVRNRGRTAPAVAAVLAAVAGTVAVATFAASQDRQDRDTYEARAPHGVFALSIGSDQGRELGAARTAVAKELPVAARADVFRLTTGARTCDQFSSQPGCGSVQPVTPKANQCPLDDMEQAQRFTAAQRRAFFLSWRCDYSSVAPVISAEGDVVVGGPDVLRALGIGDAAARTALARGETVVFNRPLFDRGTLKLRLVADTSKVVPGDSEPQGPVKALPARLITSAQAYGVAAIVPQQAARAAGIRTVPLGSLFTTSRMPTSAERQALTGDLAKLGTETTTYLERGFQSTNSVVLLALGLFAGLVTVGAAGIATGLAQADAQPDLRTLAAVGAAPRVRRTLSGFQCGVIAAMGVILGTAAGVLPAIGLRRTERQRSWHDYRQAMEQGWAGSRVPHVPIVVPWGTLALLLVMVPLGAMLLAALVTRSRAEIGRRAEA